MQIGKQFNQLKFVEYFQFIENHKKYTDFNVLGLYRSIVENEQLSLDQQIKIRDFANQFFQKTYDFLQLKDPFTYKELETLGLEMTEADDRQLWEQIRRNQEKILSEKKIKHRNFGVYAKHDCGVSHCPYNGLMVKQGTLLVECEMHFDSDQNKVSRENKSRKRKKDRKHVHKIINNELGHL
ncbi:hypothetical protein V6R21_01850 [Limibacter armeniacum]|uniref:hypothetical protein n=1 Tax=Limibacter armeniacum TaxID=466084 RepID=UPI002FE5353D